MYDERIERLRTHAKSYEKMFGEGESSVMMREAADAIEELQQYADLYKDLTEKSQKVATELKQQLQKSEEDNVNLTGWLAEEHAKHLWIPVTERLPIFGEVVQITDGINVGHGYLDGVRSTVGIVHMWSSPFCDIDEEHITHWMPLPEPPKEGE